MSTASGNMDIQRGLVGGAVAWIVGFVVAYVLITLDIVELMLSDFDFVLLTFSEWHLAPLILGNDLATSIVWAIVPIVILLIAGFLVANQRGGDAMDGASITIGYFLLVLLSVVYLLTMLDPAPDAVDMIVHLIVGGIVFPAVFGGIGGFIAQEV